MKIGIFDSGLGGLFLMRPIAEALPRYDYLYLGDTAKLPYGDKSPNEVYRLALKAVKYLLEHNCELVLVLCNTISAEALRKMQMEFLPKHFPKRRILGIIIPTVEAVYQLYTQPPSRRAGLPAIRTKVGPHDRIRSVENSRICESSQHLSQIPACQKYQHAYSRLHALPNPKITHQEVIAGSCPPDLPKRDYFRKTKNLSHSPPGNREPAHEVILPSIPRHHAHPAF